MFRILIKQHESYKQFGMTEELATKKFKLDEANFTREMEIAARVRPPNLL